MSFDERMALYKRKYNPPAPGSGDPKPASGKAPDQNRAARKNTGKAKEAVPDKAAQQPQEQTVPVAATQEKKGVFSRLLGIFRKK